MAKPGRKPKYQNVEDMQTRIDEYFESHRGKVSFDGKGNVSIIAEKPVTILGLARHLGFSSRQALQKYQNKQAFVVTVTRAKARIEEYAERQLYNTNGMNGAMFTLRCNFGWKLNKGDNGKEAMPVLRFLF